MFFRKFGDARSLVPEFVFSCACAKAGIPLLLVAPPSGGKSTVIFALEKWLEKYKEPNLRVSRLGLRGIQQLSDYLRINRTATLLNEDYALIGSSGYMVEKMGALIGSLSYSKTYQDWGMRVNLTVDRLGFVSGVQPYWLTDMVENPAFATHLREKFVRYYMLPMSITKDLDDMIAIRVLSEKVKYKYSGLGVKIPEDFTNALTLQIGKTRADRYGSALARQLACLVPSEEIEAILRFYAVRIAFENLIMEREISERGYDVQSRWHEYTVLYWLLRRGALTRDQLATCLGVTTLRSVDRATSETMYRGWITSYYNNGEKRYIVNPTWKRRFVE